MKSENGYLAIPSYPMPLPVQRIVRLEGRGNYTVIYFHDSTKPYMTSATLRLFEEQLPGFLRVSKSALLNPDHIVNLDRVNAKTATLMLSDGREIRISRRRVEETIRKLAVYEVPHKTMSGKG